MTLVSIKPFIMGVSIKKSEHDKVVRRKERTTEWKVKHKK